MAILISRKACSIKVGAGLARDGYAAVCLTDHIARIASKPAPTEAIANHKLCTVFRIIWNNLCIS